MLDKILKVLNCIGCDITNVGTTLENAGHTNEAKRALLVGFLIMLACMVLKGDDEGVKKQVKRLIIILVDVGYLPNPTSQDEYSRSELN